MTRYLNHAPLRTRICHVLAGGFQPFGNTTFPTLAFQADAAVGLGLKVGIFSLTSSVSFDLSTMPPELLGMDTAEVAQ